MIIETSQDVLWLSIAFAVVLVAVFLAWMMYYIIMMLRDIREMVHDTRDRFDRIEKFVMAIGEKAEALFAIGPMLGEGIKTAVGYIMERREEKRRR
ncbi:hypothetical protein EPO33_05325 [Patescibacteria group bacterium]|nr:MAG: hypothetical protein EPO33_05325 [Patescibacteria group bacterium]